MNKLHKSLTLSILTIIGLNFSACKKDNPVLENNQEEFDGTTITLTAGHFHGAEFHAHDETPIVVSYENNGFGFSPESINLHEGETYLMEISIFQKGKNINAEFDAKDHQFFFVGAPADVLDYEYKDDRLGLRGALTVKATAVNGFDLNVILRHGLNKQHESAQAWNSTNYFQAGGADDFNRKFKIFALEGDEHDH